MLAINEGCQFLEEEDRFIKNMFLKFIVNLNDKDYRLDLIHSDGRSRWLIEAYL